MTITSYAGLQASIDEWLDGADLSANAGDFIMLAEADFRRQLVMPDMETVVTINGTNPIALPVDLDSIRVLVSPETTDYPQQEVVPVDLAAFYRLSTIAQGAPARYAVDGLSLYVWPIPAVALDLALAYRVKLPSLSDTTTTNWLLDQHPDAYLFGSLLQAEFFGWNDQRLPLIQTKLQSIIDDINKAGNRKRYGGQIAMRPSIREKVGCRW